MAVNLIVSGVTLLMAGFLGVWIFFPRLRAWVEMPKYRFLERQRQLLVVFQEPQPAREEPSQQEGRRPEASANF